MLPLLPAVASPELPRRGGAASAEMRTHATALPRARCGGRGCRNYLEPGDFRRFLNRQKARAAFRHMDENDSGRVGQSEVLAAVVQIFRCAPPPHLPNYAVPGATWPSGSPFQQPPLCSAFRVHADGGTQKQRRRRQNTPWGAVHRGRTQHPVYARPPPTVRRHDRHTLRHAAPVPPPCACSSRHACSSDRGPARPACSSGRQRGHQSGRGLPRKAAGVSAQGRGDCGACGALPTLDGALDLSHALRLTPPGKAPTII